MKNKVYHFVIFVFLQFTCEFLSAQANSGYSDLKNNDAIPFNPEVFLGKLPNGFTYYLFKSSNPEDKVVMNLVVKAGFEQEEEDQIEVSHLLEHMAFRETSHFKNPVDFFEQHGLRYGMDIQATTASIRTVYKLFLPSQNADIVRNGLLFLRDCAQGLSLAPGRIDLERGAVLEELRRRDGYEDEIRIRLNKKLLGKTTSNNRSYSQRMASVKKVTEKQASDFYEKWYRPSREALIVTGYIDTADVAKQVRMLFSDLRDAPHPIKPLVASNSGFEIDRYIKVVHPELKRTAIRLYGENHHFGPHTRVSDIRSALVEELSSLLLNARLDNIEEKVNGDHEFSHYVEKLDEVTKASVITVSADHGVAQAARNALVEVERIKRYGFSNEEIANAKSLFLKAYGTSGVSGPNEIATDLVWHFSQNEAAPGKAIKHDIIRDLFTRIKAEELRNIANNWNSFEDGLRLVVLSGNDNIELPDESTIREWLAEIRKMKIEPHRENADQESELLSLEKSIALEGTSIVSESVVAEIGVTRLLLSNGVEVLLKPLATSEKKIALQALASGGSSFYDGDAFLSAFYAANIVSQSGLSSFSPAEFRNFLNVNGIQVYPYLAHLERGVKGVSDSASFERLLQAVYLYFTEPKLDINAFNTMISSLKRKILADRNNPEQIFYNAISVATNNANLIHGIDSAETLDRIDAKVAYNIYRECFRDASKFTFAIAGDFDVAVLKPLIGKYLGSLPPEKGQPIINKVKANKAKANIDTSIFARTEKKATIQLIFSGDYMFNMKNNTDLDLLANALQFVLTDRLRHQERGTYFVSTGTSYSKVPIPFYGISIGFDCDPSNVERMIGAALEELKKIQTEGLSRDIFNKVIAQQSSDLRERLKRPAYWCSYLSRQVADGDELTANYEMQRLIETKEHSTIKTAAKRYLQFERIMRFVLLPKKEE